jgi:hypothetical protein
MQKSIILDTGVLVRMSELYPDASVLTLDSDFKIYRKHRDRAIPIVSPNWQ